MMLRDYDKVEFKSISDESASEVSKEEQEKIDSVTADNKRLLDTLKEALNGKVNDVVVSSKLVDAPVCVSTKDGLSLEMEKTLNEQPGAEDTVKAEKILEINPNHPLFEAFSKIQNDDETVKNYASVLYEEAMLLEGREIVDKKAFVDKINELFIKAMK
jgi:molecular chaperone HtpG